MEQKIVITAHEQSLVTDLKKHQVDLHNIKNRRFMFNPNTGTFFLGKEDRLRKKHDGSHSEEFHDAAIQENFDDFVRGWIGYNKSDYKHGIIHFAPNICEATFGEGYDTLVMFASQLGIDAKTQVRGFIRYGEQLMKDLLPGRFQ